METENLLKAFESIREALIELAKRFCEWVLAKVEQAKKVWEQLKEALTPLYYEERLEESLVYVWQDQQQIHHHQVINRIKVQEHIMRSYQQPWKAWKAQRR